MTKRKRRIAVRPANWWHRRVFDHAEVVRLHVEEKRTFSEIGASLGVSRERIRQIVRKAGVRVETSKAMRARASEEVVLVCAACGHNFTPANRKRTQQTCSLKCAGVLRRRESPPHIDSATGHLVMYSYISGRTMRYARYVMEQHLGRRLQSKEWVTFRDGNRYNCSLENLEIVTPTEMAIRREIKRGRRHEDN